MALALEIAREQSESARAHPTGPGPRPPVAARRKIPWWPRSRLSEGEMTFFLSQLNLVLETGSPLAPGLRQIAAQESHPRLTRLARAMVEDLEGGNTFAGCLARHPDVFSPLEVSMIQVGEAGGFLGEMLNRVAELRARRSRIRSTVRGALTYPMVLLAVATGVVIFMMGFVFPRFEQIFASMEGGLPLSTRILIGTSGYVRAHWYVLLPALAALVFAAYRSLQSASGARTLERVRMRLPWIGELWHQMALSQLFLNLGSLLQARVPLLSALQVCRGTMGEQAYRDLVDDLVGAAERGEGLAAAFARSSLVPGLTRSLLATGEETGRSERVLLRLAGYYDEQVEKRLKLMSTLLEPLLLVLMGGVVGFVVISLVLPILRLSRAVH